MPFSCSCHIVKPDTFNQAKRVCASLPLYILSCFSKRNFLFFILFWKFFYRIWLFLMECIPWNINQLAMHVSAVEKATGKWLCTTSDKWYLAGSKGRCKNIFVNLSTIIMSYSSAKAWKYINVNLFSFF